jgi:hypothetical protein
MRELITVVAYWIGAFLGPALFYYFYSFCEGKWFERHVNFILT